VLAAAPTLAEVEPELSRRISDAIVVGHDVSVDWRLLTRRRPGITPTRLLATLRLARHVQPGVKGRSLAALLDHYELTGW
jgi:DNA polymerase III subunit epsilon